MLSSSIFAQKAELTSAILSFRKQDMESAKSYVDAAEEKLNNGGTLKVKDLGKFWHHKGLVYYSLYDASKDVNLLETAANAFKTALPPCLIFLNTPLFPDCTFRVIS